MKPKKPRVPPTLLADQGDTAIFGSEDGVERVPVKHGGTLEHIWRCPNGCHLIVELPSGERHVIDADTIDFEDGLTIDSYPILPAEEQQP